MISIEAYFLMLGFGSSQVEAYLCFTLDFITPTILALFIG